MEILHESTDSKGTFYIEKSGKRLAEMTYSKAGADKIIIDHTEVSEELKGQGAGKKLVVAAVEKARKEGFKILPLCPFAKATIQKDASLQDVLA
ncbi:GNAT family N-acetyltransferase [Penaeicola halotolerans]|uniref:GNAT family N-acetyltransferase n=1 Tax=Penaeicola halotolerans TaxID=2793196 RepID=UPI001CF82CFB|nr:GNAT family N-acetyltransferase [Penaeicola halotolerans]